MTGSQFAMVSDWMVNGSINDFAKAHPDANRLELVGFLFKVSPSPLLTDEWMTNLAGRCRQGVDLHS